MFERRKMSVRKRGMRRCVGVLMAAVILISSIGLPVPVVYSAELIIDSESFDINTNVMEIEFTMSMTQYVNIAVYEYDGVDDEGRPRDTSLIGYIIKSGLAVGEEDYEPQHYRICDLGDHPSPNASDVDITKYREFQGVKPPEERGYGAFPSIPVYDNDNLEVLENDNDSNLIEEVSDMKEIEDDNSTEIDGIVSDEIEQESRETFVEEPFIDSQLGSRSLGMIRNLSTVESSEFDYSEKDHFTDLDAKEGERDEDPSNTNEDSGTQHVEVDEEENEHMVDSEEKPIIYEPIDYGPQVLSLTTRILTKEEWEAEQRQKLNYQTGIATFGMEMTEGTSLSFDEEQEVNRLIWDGRINRYAGLFETANNGEPDWYPTLGSVETQDFHAIFLQIEMIGYPWRNIKPECEWIDNGDGTFTERHDFDSSKPGNWEWSNHRDYYLWTSIFVIDYRAGAYLKIAQNELNDCIHNFLKLYQWGILDFDELTLGIEEGDPVNVISGNFSFKRTDMEVYGYWPLKWERYYNSLDENPNGLGMGFSHTYDYTLEDDRGIIRIEGPYGQYLEFMREYMSGKDVYRPLQDADFELDSGDRETYMLIYKDGSQFKFLKETGKIGRLMKITNPGGLLIADLTYDIDDRLVTIENRAGKIDLTWSGDYIRKVSDHADRSVEYTYDDGHMIAMTNLDGYIAQYIYDRNGYMEQIYDFEGDCYLSNEYDAVGRVLIQNMYITGEPAVMRIQYNDEARCNTVETFLGEIKKYYYDGNGQVIKVKDTIGESENVWNDQYRAEQRVQKDGSEITYELDNYGNVQKAFYEDGNRIETTHEGNRITSKTHRRGNRTETYQYENGNLKEYADGEGNRINYTYQSGLLISQHDPDGNVTNYEYNASGQMISIEVPSIYKISFEYDSLGRKTKETDKLGAVTYYKYSPGGNLLSIEKENGLSQSYTYNKNGFITSATDYRGNTEYYEYAGFNLVSAHVDKAGNRTSYTYSPEGLLLGVMDFNGNEVRYEYDNKGRQTKSIDALGNEIERRYNSMGRIQSIIDQEGHMESYEYDGMGRQTKIIDRNGAVQELYYDYDGNLIKEIRYSDPENAVTEYVYDHANRLISIIDPEEGETRYNYNGNGQLLKETDPAGRTVCYEYDSAGRTTKEIDGNGLITEYKYDAAGNVLTLINPAGREKYFEYNNLGYMLTETSFAGKVTAYDYDENGNLIKEINPEGGITFYEYDPLDRPVSITDPMGNEIQYFYKGTYGVERIVYPDSLSEVYEYNELGLVQSRTDRAGYSTYYTYTPRMEQASETDAEGGTTYWEYDPAGNEIKMIRSGVTLVQSEYDALGRLIGKTDPKGTIRYSYDLLDQMVAYQNKIGGITQYKYDGSGNILSVQDAEGGIICYEYDAGGRTTKRISPRSLSTEIIYDDTGNIIEVRDSFGKELWIYDEDDNIISYTDRNSNRELYQYSLTNQLIRRETEIQDAPKVVKYEFIYDLNGNILEMVDPHELKVTYSYDWAGNPLTEIDQANFIERYGYDANFNLISIEDRNGNRTRYGYNKLNQIIEMTAPEGETIQYSYDTFYNVDSISQLTEFGMAVTKIENDPVGNIVGVVSPLGFTTTYSTDGEGNITQIIDADGNVNNFEYDKLSRVVHADYKDGLKAWYDYDKDSNLVLMEEDLGSYRFEYDLWNRLIKSVDVNGHTFEYEYDLNGNRISLSYPDGTMVDYEYDHMNRMIAMMCDGEMKKYQYDAKGQLILEELPSGEAVSYTYNEVGQVKDVTTTDQLNRARRQTVYGYHPNGLLWSEARQGIGIGFKDEYSRYTYNKSGNLLEATNEGMVTSYEYDIAGNLISETNHNQTTIYQYDLQNRLVEKETVRSEIETFRDITSYLYDKRGNLIQQDNSDGQKTFVYNSMGKLEFGANESGETSRYTYNGLGVRVFHEENRDNFNAVHQNGKRFPSSWATSGTIEQIMKHKRENWQRVWESTVGTVIQNDRETVSRYYAVDYTSAVNRDLFVDEKGGYKQNFFYDTMSLTPISINLAYAEGTVRENREAGENPGSDIAAQNTEQIWFYGDLRGSNVYGTDASGDIFFHMIYDEWGVPRTETKVDLNFYGLDNLNNYTGYVYDEVLALYFAQARFYDPKDRRFVQEDPALDGFNWYRYADNNPLTKIDPHGLAAGDLYINDTRISPVVKISDYTMGGIRTLVNAVGGTLRQEKTSAYGGDYSYIAKVGKKEFTMYIPKAKIGETVEAVVNNPSNKWFIGQGWIQYSKVTDFTGNAKLIVDVDEFIELSRDAKISIRVEWDLGSIGGTWYTGETGLFSRSGLGIPLKVIFVPKDMFQDYYNAEVCSQPWFVATGVTEIITNYFLGKHEDRRLQELLASEVDFIRFEQESQVSTGTISPLQGPSGLDIGNLEIASPYLEASASYSYRMSPQNEKRYLVINTKVGSFSAGYYDTVFSSI